MAKKLGTLKIKRLFLGTDSGNRGTEVTSSAAELNVLDGVTAVAAELNYLDITTLGTGAASKAVVLDAGDDFTWPAAGVLTYGGTGITATGAEVNLTDNMWASVTTTFVNGTDGTGTVQFVFKDAAGVTMATPIAGMCYISEAATGLASAELDTGLATLTNGEFKILDTGAPSHYSFISSAAGLLGATITSAADSYWMCFVHPTGKLVISDEMAITGP